ncbi:cleavage and polyadenylation specificity factor 73-like [Maniola hyperantus]
MLQEMFGEDSVPKMFKGDKLHVEVDGKRAYIDLLAMEVKCTEDEGLERTVYSALSKLYAALAPVKPPPPPTPLTS